MAWNRWRSRPSRFPCSRPRRPLRRRRLRPPRRPLRRRRSRSPMAVPALAGDARFFVRTGPHSLAAVAAAAGAEAPEVALMLSGVAPLSAAGPDQVSFLDNRRYADALAASGAGAVIVRQDMVRRMPAGSVAIVTKEPYLAWARVAALFHPLPPPCPGMHPSAVVHPEAVVDG